MVRHPENSGIPDNFPEAGKCEILFQQVGDFAKVGFANYNLVSGRGYAQRSWYLNLGEEPGTALDRVIGIYRRMHPEDRRRILEIYERIRSGRLSSCREECRILIPGEETKWICINLVVQKFAPQTDMIDILCINYDITSLKRAQLAMQAAKCEAEEAARLKSAFIDNMSHEIRTPLNAIVGFSNLLMTEQDERRKEEYICYIRQNNEQLLQIITDILEISSLEAGPGLMETEPCNLGEICTEVLQAFHNYATGELRMYNDIPDSTACIHSNKKFLFTILNHLMKNAVKFTPAGEIVLGFALSGQGAEIFVKDTGPGIDPEKREVIFEKFVKLDAYRQGAGLGLYICKELASRLGGRIWADAGTPEGACFRLALPGPVQNGEILF